MSCKGDWVQIQKANNGYIVELESYDMTKGPSFTEVYPTLSAALFRVARWLDGAVTQVQVDEDLPTITVST